MSKHKRAARAPESGEKAELDPVPLPSFQSMERLLAGMTGARRSKTKGLDEAQQRMYDAWETDDPEERIMLASEALAHSPDCADAYILLAEELAQSVEELIRVYRLGVAAGERAVGKRTFKEDAGYFWAMLETRPYMRARCSLAQALWRTGEHDEAVGHYQDLLRLNPNDNQGVRDLLMPCLIELNRDSEAEKLFKQYDDDSMATWVYSRALLDFRRGGDVPDAVTALRKAVQYNRHVPAYLLGHRKIPTELPEYVGFGDANEAVSYAYGNKAAWTATQGALRWLDANRK